MRLYLLRHGESESRAVTDAQRQLTDGGRDEAYRMAAKFEEKGLSFERCISSPYIRAVQTAEAFLSRLSEHPPIEVNENLTPEKRAYEVMGFLEGEKVASDASLLIVSHNPLISELNSMLVEGNIHRMTILENCDMTAIDLQIIGNGMGTRSFYLSPKDYA